MVKLVIANKRCRFPDSWSEISLKQASEINIIIQEADDEIKNYLLNPIAENCSQNVEKYVDKVAKKAINIFCNIDQNIVNKINNSDVSKLFNTLLIGFVRDLVFSPAKPNQKIDSFRWKGEKLFIPKSAEDINGVEIALANVSAKEFCEASDIKIASQNSKNPIKYGALITAILCRPKNEKYSEQKIIQRDKTMTDIPMSVVMQVFFA